MVMASLGFHSLRVPSPRAPAVALLLLVGCFAASVAPVDAFFQAGGNGGSTLIKDIDLKPIVDALVVSATAQLRNKTTALHPLDPLTLREWAIVESSLATKLPRLVDCSSPFDVIFIPAPKSYVKSWRTGRPLGRSVSVTCFNGNSGFNVAVIVAVPSGNVTSVKDISPFAAGARRSTLAVTPSNSTVWNINRAISQELLRPASTSRKFGVGFTVTGNVVRWGNWQFHVRWDPRVGMILSMLQYVNAGAADASGGFRDVAYEMHVSEVFQPFLSTRKHDASFEAAENGLGMGTGGPYPLIPNNDCPHDAVFLHGLNWGEQSVRASKVYPNAICIFERFTGDISWRHANQYAKAEVTLVVRSLSVIFNTDYVFDYEFLMDGTIKPKAQATGYPDTQPPSANQGPSLNASGINPALDGDDGVGGTYVNRGAIASIHQHFFNYRLDLDIDGPSNSFVEAKLVGVLGIGTFGDGDKVKVVKTTAVREANAVYTSSDANPSKYLITNTNRRTSVGNLVGYSIHSSTTARSFKSGTDFYGACAPWARTEITVTAYDPTQKYASGEVPDCKGVATDGLAVWSKLNRPVKNRDLVVWHTVGLTHVPTQENWPYVSRASAGFTLEPVNFFEKNPLLYLPTWKDADFV